jgi:hypothetical protein
MKKTALAVANMVALIITSAAAQTAVFDASRVPGAWASGDGANACGTAAISYLMNDGTYVVFNRFDGPLHAIGRWRLEGATFYMTHNDGPFPEDGAASEEATLTVTRLDTDRFVSTNAAGRERVRIRCRGLVLPPGAQAGHGH